VEKKLKITYFPQWKCGGEVVDLVIMKKNIQRILIVSLLLYSCKSEHSSEKDTISFVNTVYYFTLNFDSTDCTVHSACDCCSDHLVFLNDKEFVFINYCLADKTYFKGKYKILDSTLQLNFNSTHVSQNYNSEATSTIENEYTITKTTWDPQPRNIAIFHCKDKTCLNASSESVTSYGVRDSLQVNQMIDRMKKDGIWEKL